jgi:hypothetical protein
VALARVFEEAGLPEGLLHVIPGGPDAGEAMITDPLVRIISFTGSTAAGRRVGELAARHLKRAHLELGGNSALVILDDADADADRAASAGAWGSFLHQGQICMTTGRHLVHEASEVVHDELELLQAPVGPSRGQGLSCSSSWLMPAERHRSIAPSVSVTPVCLVSTLGGSLSAGAAWMPKWSEPVPKAMKSGYSLPS